MVSLHRTGQKEVSNNIHCKFDNETFICKIIICSLDLYESACICMTNLRFSDSIMKARELIKAI